MKLPGLSVVLALLSVSCGPSGGAPVPAVPEDAAQPPSLPAPASPTGVLPASCAVTLETQTPYTCTLGGSGPYALQGAPQGMVVQPRSGVVRWTPSAAQTGPLTVTVLAGGVQDTLRLTVQAGEPDPAGLYVSPAGRDDAPGTAAAPFLTVQRAVDAATPGTTIYLRGGEYRNPEYGTPFATRRSNGIAKIRTVGDPEHWTTLRPFGNEFATLVSDESGLIFNAGAYWIVDGLELQGSAQTLGPDDALAEWWADDDSRTNGRGIVNNDAHHITVRNSVIHDFPGAGIGSNGADLVTVDRNVIYRNGWWTTAGTHGVANSTLTSRDPAAAGQDGLVMTGNLVFANQSRIISHVFAKGSVALTIDEGNGLHAQNTSGTFRGAARITGNLLLWNGKAGVGLNTIDGAVVLNNALYQNAQVVTNSGELTLQSSSPARVAGNLFSPRAGRPTIRDAADRYVNVGVNYTTGSDADRTLPADVQTVPQVFRDPAALDFRAAPGLPAGVGVPDAELARMFDTVRTYGIDVQAPAQGVDAATLDGMKRRIFAGWPATHRDLTLVDRASGWTYTYAQR